MRLKGVSNVNSVTSLDLENIRRELPFISCYSEGCWEVPFHCIKEFLPFFWRYNLLSLIIFLEISVPEI